MVQHLLGRLHAGPKSCVPVKSYDFVFSSATSVHKLRPAEPCSTSGRDQFGGVSARLPSRRVSTSAASNSSDASSKISGSFIDLAGSRQSSRGGTSASASVATASPVASPPQAPIEAPYLYIAGQRVHSMHDRGFEVINSMSGWADTELMRLLKPVESCWQPSDLLPDSSSPDFYDQVIELRRAAAELPNDYMAVLVGDMVTEEALPSYMNMLNTLDGVRDETGAQDHPWARWNREWTAEENRHGDLLNKYLYLTGKVDMRSVEVTIQNLIGSGLDPKLENNPYLCFVYTSFQERATKISHGNTARLAAYHGDTALTKVCGLIAADEGRHEVAYTSIVEQLFARDPEGATLAFADMMKKGITMPAHYMDDGWHSEPDANPRQNLFVDYATAADAIGVYTTGDYADIVQHLVQRWRVADLRLQGGAALEAQDFLCKHSERIRRLADLQMERRLRDRKRGRAKSASFSWIFKREVSLT